VAAINVALKRYNDYVAVLESERDMWRSVSVQEKRRVTVLDSTIQSLAKDHRRLELVAAAARRSELDMWVPGPRAGRGAIALGSNLDAGWPAHGGAGCRRQEQEAH